MDGELLCKIIQRIKAVAGVKAFLILAMAALHLTVMPRRIRANEFMPDVQLGGGLFKQSRQVALTVGKAVGKLKAVIRLHTLHLNSAARIPRSQLAKEIC